MRFYYLKPVTAYSRVIFAQARLFAIVRYAGRRDRAKMAWL